MRAESACLLGCRTAPLPCCHSCTGNVRGVVSRLSSVLFYWKPHYHCTLIKPDTTCSWARNNTSTRRSIILLSPHSSRTCYPQPFGPLTAVRLSQHVYSSKCEMHLAYRQYAFGAVVLPSYQDQWQQLSLAATGLGNWLNATGFVKTLASLCAQ
jgi:hypothetical protein